MDIEQIPIDVGRRDVATLARLNKVRRETVVREG